MNEKGKKDNLKTRKIKRLKMNLKKGVMFCLRGKKEMRCGQGIRASLTVEASLSLTLFLFTVILLSVPMEILDTQRKVQTVLEAAGRELSQAAYLSCRDLAWGEEKERKGMEGQEKGGKEKEGTEKRPGKDGEAAAKKSEAMEFLGVVKNGAVSIYLSERIKKAVGDGRLEYVDCRKTFLSEDGEILDLRADYRMKLPFSIFTLDSIFLSSRSLKRGWIGSEGGRLSGAENGDTEQMVYVGRDSTRYHLSADCHYISNQITGVSMEKVSEYTNRSGRHYRLCSTCRRQEGKDAGQTAYILPGGEYYHSRADCPSLRYYVKKVPLSEVSYLGPCSYCAGKR